MLVTLKEWIKSVLNYRSYLENKTGYPFLDHPVYLVTYVWQILFGMQLLMVAHIQLTDNVRH